MNAILRGFLTLGTLIAVGTLLASVDRATLRQQLDGWLSGGRTDGGLGAQTEAIDRKIAVADQEAVALAGRRTQHTQDRQRESRLLRDLEMLAQEPYGALSPQQLQEAMLALQAARSGDRRRLEDLDRQVREAVQRKLALLQEKKDLFDDQYRAMLRQYLEELLRTSQTLAGP